VRKLGDGEQLALRQERERAADLVQRSLQHLDEREEAHPRRVGAQRDQHRRLPCAQVDGRQRVVPVERVASAATLFGMERQVRELERTEVTVVLAEKSVRGSPEPASCARSRHHLGELDHLAQLRPLDTPRLRGIAGE
jgi:hypothetical protein